MMQDIDLFAEVIFGKESSYGRADTSKPNSQNVRGPMQVMQSTFDGLQRQGLIPADFKNDNPEHNMAAGRALISQLSDQYNGDFRKVAAAYYGGPKAVRADGTIADFGNRQNPNHPTTIQYSDDAVRRLEQKRARRGAGVSLTAFTDAGWGSEIEFARGRGIDDKTIFDKLTAEQGRMREGLARKADLETGIAGNFAVGADITKSLSQLRAAGFNDEIEFARGLGKTSEEIVAKLAPMATQRGTTARAEMTADGGLVTGAKSARDRVMGLIRGGKQLVAGVSDNADWTRELEQEEAAMRADLGVAARDSTAAGKVGSFAPDLAAGIGAAIGAPLVGAGATIGGLAAMGAAYGAIQPTVEGESRLSNAAIGAAGGAAGVLAGRAIGAGAGGIKNFRTGRVSEADTRLAVARQAEVPGYTIDPSITRLSPEWVKANTRNYNQGYAAVREGVELERSDDLVEALGKIGESGSVPRNMREKANSLLFKGKDGEGNWVARTDAVAAEEIATLRSGLGKLLSTSTSSDLRRELLGDSVTAIDDSITAAMTRAGRKEQYDALQTNYGNFKAATNMSRAMDEVGGGELTPEVVRAGISTGRNRAKFERGDAPYQDLHRAMVEDSARPIGDAVQRAAESPLTLGAMVLVPQVGVPFRLAAFIMQAMRRNPMQKAWVERTLSMPEQAALSRAASGAIIDGDEAIVQAAVAKVAERMPEVMTATTAGRAGAPQRAR